jgi:hypothetical protein
MSQMVFNMIQKQNIGEEIEFSYDARFFGKDSLRKSLPFLNIP